MDIVGRLTKNGTNCNAHRNNPLKVDTHVWEPVSTSMKQIHIDFAGPFLGKMFLIMVDAYSKLPEVHVMSDISAKTTISKCRQIFSAFGLPQVLVTDNGKTFMSHEFQQFLRVNGIMHRITAPYNPATNGQAERFVQTLKQALKHMKYDISNVNLALSQILVQYRSMAHALTNKSSAEMFLGRKLRTRLDFVLPTKEKIISNQDEIKNFFSKGERVACRNYSSGENWKFGRIVARLSKLHYKIVLDDDRSWTRHVNQMRAIGENTLTDNYSQNESYCRDIIETAVVNQNIPRIEEVQQPPRQPDEVQITTPASPQGKPDRNTNSFQQTQQRSNRVKKRPNYLSEYVPKQLFSFIYTRRC